MFLLALPRLNLAALGLPALEQSAVRASWAKSRAILHARRGVRRATLPYSLAARTAGLHALDCLEMFNGQTRDGAC
jgi:hypothetical protein